MINVYLADDQQMLNSALVALLELESDITVVGSALDGNQALADIKRLNPDVAILDIEMPKLTGLEVASTLQEENASTQVIILTTFAQQHYFQQAVAYDVAGYLLKDNTSQSLIANIHSIVAGNRVFDPELVQSVLTADINPLTDRELEILQLIKSGTSTKNIAEQVYLTEGTVRNYVSSILSKTGTHSRIEAVNVAEANKWLS